MCTARLSIDQLDFIDQRLLQWLQRIPSTVPLGPVGLIVLADLPTVARRTTLTGTSCLLDSLVICPGLHTQQKAPELNLGEYPACAAMTTGYVFRVENPATVVFLQKVGETGKLTTLTVSSLSGRGLWWNALVGNFEGETWLSACVYLLAVTLTLTTVGVLAALGDWWMLGVVGLLVFVRLINIVVIRRRAAKGWHGALEPGVQGDLLILLSQDRWVRIKGAVDDLKAITSGQWMSDPTLMESGFVALATLLVYLDAALSGNGTQEGKVLLVALLLVSPALLGLANEWTGALKMHGRMLRREGKPVKYARRRDMADQLIREMGRDDWAIRLGMIVRDDATGETEKTM